VDAAPRESWFRAFSCRVATAVGSHTAFLIALAIVLAWAISGPVFGFSDSWQLVINTGTTIVTFLMVFLIQATQNRDGKAIQLKLDELIRAQKSARNVFADLEHATEEELRKFETEFKALRARGLSKKAARR
jgi:low affinity Fe/Cu permease